MTYKLIAIHALIKATIQTYQDKNRFQMKVKKFCY